VSQVELSFDDIPYEPSWSFEGNFHQRAREDEVAGDPRRKASGIWEGL